jgi:hypothetical protein
MLAGERPTQGAPAMPVLHGIHQAGCSVTPDLVFLLDTWHATRALRPDKRGDTERSGHRWRCLWRPCMCVIWAVL